MRLAALEQDEGGDAPDAAEVAEQPGHFEIAERRNDAKRLGVEPQACDRSARAGAENRVSADQRAVEIAGEGLDRAAEPVGQEAQLPADEETNSATSAICWGSS